MGTHQFIEIKGRCRIVVIGVYLGCPMHGTSSFMPTSS
ncbi:hypothetical protein LINPERPRIM_LOCUS22132 [Linum perenne]